jgi:hypothetical protein
MEGQEGVQVGVGDPDDAIHPVHDQLAARPGLDTASIPDIS